MTIYLEIKKKMWGGWGKKPDSLLQANRVKRITAKTLFWHQTSYCSKKSLKNFGTQLKNYVLSLAESLGCS
tara:strand:+ start:108 stop:320 length:213 start_codon:yes stop_codon:yes gene_type:complete